MTIKIGINPVTWTNDDLPDLGSHIPLETCLKEAKEAGYQGIEMGNKFPRNASELRPYMTTAGLELVSGWFSGNLLSGTVEDEITRLENHIELLKAMGSPVLIYADVTDSTQGKQDTPLSYRPQLPESLWKEFGQKMSAIGSHCKKHGLTLAYHYHMGTVVQSATDLDRFMEHTSEDVGLLLDTGHAVYGGIDPLEIIKKHGTRICHVHCKDIREDVLGEETTVSSELSAISLHRP